MMKLLISAIAIIVMNFGVARADELPKIQKGTNFFRDASEKEIKQFCKDTFKKADKNGDGKIIESEAPEAKVYNGDNKPIGSRKVWMNQFDSNNDGYVVFNEYFNRISYVSKQLKTKASNIEECKLCKVSN